MQEILGILVLTAAIIVAIRSPYRRDAEVAERLERLEATREMKACLGLPLDWDDSAAIFARQMRF